MFCHACTVFQYEYYYTCTAFPSLSSIRECQSYQTHLEVIVKTGPRIVVRAPIVSTVIALVKWKQMTPSWTVELRGAIVGRLLPVLIMSLKCWVTALSVQTLQMQLPVGFFCKSVC